MNDQKLVLNVNVSMYSPGRGDNFTLSNSFEIDQAPSIEQMVIVMKRLKDLKDQVQADLGVNSQAG